MVKSGVYLKKPNIICVIYLGYYIVTYLNSNKFLNLNLASFSNNMKNYFFKSLQLLLLLLISQLGVTQNLVVNGSFEQSSSCPDKFGQISKAIGWEALRKTPDYFNQCSDVIDADAPLNIRGEQDPDHGKAYASITTWTDNRLGSDQELLGTYLSEPLVPLETYYVEFKVSLADKYELASNNIGANFFEGKPNINDPLFAIDLPDVNEAVPVEDKTEWTTIKGTFTPVAAVDYLAIGNFYNTNNTITLRAGPQSGIYAAHYYVDDVCVALDPKDCQEPRLRAKALASTEIFCIGESVEITDKTVGIVTSYKWIVEGSNEGELTDKLPSFTFDSAGTYSIKLIVQSTAFPDTILNDTVEYLDVITIKGIDRNFLGKDVEVSLDTGYSISITGPGTVEWENGSEDKNRVFNKPGTYYVDYTDECGVFRDSIVITCNNFFPESNLPDETFLRDGKVTLDASFEYVDGDPKWSHPNGREQFAAIIEGNDHGVYNVSIPQLCADVFEKDILVKPFDCDVYFPNAFSPNGDGINDTWTPQVSCRLISYEMSVYNRWGELVVSNSGQVESSTEISEQLSSDDNLSSGVYMYVFSYVGLNGEEEFQNTVTGTLNVTF